MTGLIEGGNEVVYRAANASKTCTKIHLKLCQERALKTVLKFILNPVNRRAETVRTQFIGIIQLNENQRRRNLHTQHKEKEDNCESGGSGQTVVNKMLDWRMQQHNNDIFSFL